MREHAGPRERAVEAGLDALGDGDLVAIVLGTGCVGQPVDVLAAEVLAEHGGLSGLAHAGLGALAARRGMGQTKGVRLAAAVELGRRVAAESGRTREVRFSDAAAVSAWARGRLAFLDYEELWLLALDGQNRLRAARRVAAGGLHGLHVRVRDVLRIALREGASAFVLVHNHPSGDATPSAEDIVFTRGVADAACRVGTPLMDHVIVAQGCSSSMLDLALLGGLPEEKESA